MTELYTVYVLIVCVPLQNHLMIPCVTYSFQTVDGRHDLEDEMERQWTRDIFVQNIVGFIFRYSIYKYFAS